MRGFLAILFFYCFRLKFLYVFYLVLLLNFFYLWKFSTPLWNSLANTNAIGTAPAKSLHSRVRTYFCIVAIYWNCSLGMELSYQAQANVLTSFIFHLFRLPSINSSSGTKHRYKPSRAIALWVLCKVYLVLSYEHKSSQGSFFKTSKSNSLEKHFFLSAIIFSYILRFVKSTVSRGWLYDIFTAFLVFFWIVLKQLMRKNLGINL